MTIEDIRDEMSQKTRTLEPLGKTLVFRFDDESMLIDGTGEKNVVSLVSGETVEADCSVRMSMETFLKLRRREIKPLMAVASGKIKVEGDLSIAAKLKRLI